MLESSGAAKSAGLHPESEQWCGINYEHAWSNGSMLLQRGEAFEHGEESGETGRC